MQKYLLEQFNSTYNTTGWFVSFKQSVQDLTEAQAREKLNPGVHSIYEIVTHLVYWNERYLQKFKRQKLAESVSHNAFTFRYLENLTWPEILTEAGYIFNDWQTELENINEEKLKPSADSKNDWTSIIGYINTHNAYHIGQIVIIRKLQGSWKSDNGVK